MTAGELKKHPWQVVVMWACDCAERALLRERSKGREPNERSWKAIEVTRCFLLGRASREELRAAARDAYAAAYGAAYAATYGGAYVSAAAAYGAAYVSDAAYAAAYVSDAGVFRPAVRAAVRAVEAVEAKEKEKEWQDRRFSWLVQCWSFAGERSLWLIPEGKLSCLEDVQLDFGLTLGAEDEKAA